MLLVNPATYVSQADFSTMPLDYDLTNYTADQQTDILVRASGMADAIMRKSLLAEERNDTFTGDGSSVLSLGRWPLLYVRKMQFFQPGGQGYIVPLGSVRIDPRIGTLTQYAPLAIQGIGLYSVFPEDWPIQVVYGVGYGYNAVSAPTWTYADAAGPGTGTAALAPGTYAIGVTTRTQYGETLPTFHNVTTATGAIAITVVPELGADTYRVFLGSTDQNAMLVAEASAVTANAGQPISIIVSSSQPPTGYFVEAAPTTDTSALPLPSQIREAVRLLAMQILYEQNNLANRGVYENASGRKRTVWKSTEGNSGKGVPLYYSQASELLRPYSYQGLG